MLLIADAAPIIFLAKVRQLGLITDVFEARILIPSVVEKEILGPLVPPDEERLLMTFLPVCSVVDVGIPHTYATGLSIADNCVLTLAYREHADVILSDDRLLRRVAALEGFRAIGTLGILIHAKKRSILSAEKAMELFERLVEEHAFRISTPVYHAVRKELL
jgi:predicted nucleic acid-binding protein